MVFLRPSLTPLRQDYIGVLSLTLLEMRIPDKNFPNHPASHKKLQLNSNPTPKELIPPEQLFHMNDVPKRPTFEPEHTDVSQFNLEIESNFKMINLSNILSEEQVQQDLFEDRNPQEPSQSTLDLPEKRNP